MRLTLEETQAALAAARKWPQGLPTSYWVTPERAQWVVGVKFPSILQILENIEEFRRDGG